MWNHYFKIRMRSFKILVLHWGKIIELATQNYSILKYISSVINIYSFITLFKQ